MTQPATHNASFTLAHDPDVDRIVHDLIARLAEFMESYPERASVASILLGGGYGRGEGGAIRRDGQALPYNDLDFFVLTRGKAPDVAAALRDATADAAKLLHVDIDFAQRPLATLPTVASTMMFQELLHGHVTVWGDPHAIEAVPPLPAEWIPPLEAFRFLLNRGAGLVFARERLRVGQWSPEDQDFVWRNLHKCASGCGDALLVASHAYDYRLHERVKRFQILCDAAEFPHAAKAADMYQAAARFKAAPAWSGELPEAAARADALLSIWEDALMMCVRLLVPDEAQDGNLSHALACSQLSNGRPFRNLCLNVLHRTVAPWRRGLSMPPQYWVLLMLRRVMRAGGEHPEYARFLRLWNRFN